MTLVASLLAAVKTLVPASAGMSSATEEHRTFANFETFFNISVWVASFPPGEPNTCHLFLNRDLRGRSEQGPGRRRTIIMPLQDTVTADPRREVLAVLLGAIGLRRAASWSLRLHLAGRARGMDNGR